MFICTFNSVQILQKNVTTNEPVFILSFFLSYMHFLFFHLFCVLLYYFTPLLPKGDKHFGVDAILVGT